MNESDTITCLEVARLAFLGEPIERILVHIDISDEEATRIENELSSYLYP